MVFIPAPWSAAGAQDTPAQGGLGLDCDTLLDPAGRVEDDA
ncbi:hypothetical protein [Rhodoferax sp.]|nr:hypothetical protein [Rhodoferax sp.]MDP3192280.1 hypothetical protein [Rhodoferax sp.]MDP3338091.1 hypothetical protein [Rhodoferax sp.]